MRGLLAAAALAMIVFAGCASPSAPSQAEPVADFEQLELTATATTGIIRGIVVDDAIRPISAAIVTLNGEAPQTVTTTNDGAFGFDDLAPGTYFISVSKAGYFDAQQSAEVVAGVAEPPIVKALLARDTSFVAPYVEAFVLEGYIECGVTTPVIAGAVCSFGTIVGLDITNDKFNQFIPVSKVPGWIQHELIWEATQSTGNQFNLAARTSTQGQNENGSYESGIKGKIGVSPVLIQVNATEIEDEEIGLEGLGLAPAIFSGGMEGTGVCTPVRCLFGTGATISQKFNLYTHVFYGYQPPESWRFSEEGTVPPPQ